MNGPALVAFFGSTRKGSYNAAVLRVAIEAASAAGAVAGHLEPCDFLLPLFN
jgi:NAD(P)H-dependent FMN reductase